MSKRQPRPAQKRPAPLSPDEIADVTARRAAGESWKSIGRVLGRGHETVRALYEEATADA